MRMKEKELLLLITIKKKIHFCFDVSEIMTKRVLRINFDIYSYCFIKCEVLSES